jgi:hypothetical protein
MMGSTLDPDGREAAVRVTFYPAMLIWPMMLRIRGR